MPYESNTGLNVLNQYGVRTVGGSVGVERSMDSTHQMGVELVWQNFTDGFVPNFVLPRGAHFLRFILRVDEALVLTGTTPTVLIGGTAPATNGVVLTQAEVGAVGTKIPASTGTGTWSTTSATGTTAAEKVKFQLGGTTPAVTAGAGKIRLIAEYEFKTKV